ncbi:MAG: M28 family peptidase [Muribaculaceae bacterium]|nr:M28 family peptidase [Muribaculaceae bacterium]
MNHIAISLLAMATSMAACSSGTGKTTSAEAAPQTEKAQFCADSAYSYVARQVAFGPRVPSTAAHKACGDWLVNELTRHGADTIIQQTASVSNPAGGMMPVRNIMGRFNTKAPKRILLLAHWDTRPWADNDPNQQNHSTPIDGANDGGSGVGVLLEVARQLGIKASQVGVDILFTDAEDSGIHDSDASWALGTQYWSSHMPYTSVDTPTYGILLDMVGGQNAQFDREYFSQRLAPAIVDKVWATAATLGHADRFRDQYAGAVNDDHVHVNMAGIPCIDIIECNNPATGSFNPTWHTTADNLQAIDRQTLGAVGQTVMQVIYNEQ